MDGLLTEVVVSTNGSAATAPVATGGTSVPVENLTEFATDGGKVDIAGVVYDYTGVDATSVDAEGVGGAITLPSPGLTVAVAEFDPVLLLVGDEPAVDYFAVVDLIDDEDGEPVWVPLETREERLAWPVRAYDPPLPVSLAPDLSTILRAPGVVPILDGASVDASTLDVTSLPPVPGGQTFSVDAPVATAGFPEDHGWWQVVDGEVVGFWRLVGGVWVAQTIVTQEALSVGNALVGALTGKTLTGANIQTSNIPDQGIHLDALGLRAYGPGGGSPFLNVDPAAGLVIVAGEGTFDKLTTTGDVPAGESSAELGGITEVKSGAKVKLTSGATAPTAAPTVDSTYDTVQFTNDGNWPNRHGWTTDGTYWYTLRDRPGAGSTLEKWDAVGNLVLSDDSGGAAAGLVHHSGALYALRFFSTGISPGWFVHKYDPSFNLLFTGDWHDSDGDDTPTLGIDSVTGDLLIAQSRPSDLTIPNRVRIRRYTMPVVTGDALVASTSVDTDFAYNRDLAGVTYGTHDLGANRYIFTSTGFHGYRVVNTSGTALTDEDWEAGTAAKVGFTYTGGVFKSMDTTGLMRTYTGEGKALAIGHANLTKWVSSTNFRDEATDWETPQSTRKQFSLPKRSKLTVKTAALPLAPGANDPNQVQVYVGQNETNTITNKVLAANVATLTTSVTHRLAVGNTVTVAISDAVFDGVKTVTAVTGTTFSYAKTNAPVGSTGATGTVTRTTDPGRTQMARQTAPVAGLTSTAYSSLTAPPGTNPPAANNFPDSTPSQIELADGTVFLDSSGNGSAWKTYTPTFTASVTPPTLANFTISGRYTRVGKTITFVALFTCDTAAGMGSGNYQFGLPVAARATNEIVCIAQQSGPNHGYQGRGASTTTINLFLTSTDAVATVTSTGMAAATSIRITGTYEAA